MRAAQRVGYFGKLPGCGDFIKSPHASALLAALDEWLADVMHDLPSDLRWKTHFDALAPTDFAFVGLARTCAIGGHLVASRDQSGRRYPFLLAHGFAVEPGGGFLAESPLACAPLWQTLAAVAHDCVAAANPARTLGDARLAQVQPQAGSRAALDAMLDTCSIGALADLLGCAAVRRLILGLGIVLRPVLAVDVAALEKSLVLPLPEHAPARPAVAAFWLELITPFLRRRELELALFLTRCDGRPVLVVGFAGADARTLQAIIDPALGRQLQADLADTRWVDDCAAEGLDWRALGSYLEQPHTSLRCVRDLFVNTFAGGPA